MEKYRRFGDAGTGVQPFVPEEGRPLSVGVKLTVGAACLVPRVLFLTLITPLLLAVYVTPFLGAVFRGLVRVVLAVMGFFKIVEKTYPVTAASSAKPDPAPGPGDVILTNFCSYVDVLVHSSMHATVFGFLREDKVLLKGFVGAFKHATKSYEEAEEAYKTGPTVSLKEAIEAAKAKGVPLTLFFEGTPTNGKGVLSAPPTMIPSIDAKNIKFHLRAISYYDESNRKAWNPCFTQVRPFSTHILALLSRPSHYLKVTKVTAAKTPQYSTMPDLSILQKTLIGRLCEAGSMGAMQLKRQDKEGFLQHWYETQNVDYAKPGSP